MLSARYNGFMKTKSSFGLLTLTACGVLGASAGCWQSEEVNLGGAPDSDADADSDADVDADGDGDGDGDGDTDDPGCGSVDAVCCDVEPFCEGGAMPVAVEPDGCTCCQTCEPAVCTDDIECWTVDDVPCGDVSLGGDIGACFADEDMSPISEGCEDPSAPCTTACGYTDGICLSDGTNDFCMRQCTPADDSGCDIVHHCMPFFGGSGEYIGAACIPN